MRDTSDLRGVRVLVAGAGLAGLAAARALDARGAAVTVVEARDRVGGRVWTIRDAFRHGQHAEAGADLIESEQQAMLDLVAELGLTTTRILRRGFGYYGASVRGPLALQSMADGFRAIAAPLHTLIHDYQLAEQRWDSAIARRFATQSVADWLNDIGVPRWVKQRVRGLRGLFLADPEDLSLLALVDFFASGALGGGETLRIKEGNDRLTSEIARRLRTPPQLRTVVRRVRQRKAGVVVSVEGAAGRAEIRADYLIVTLPASVLGDVLFEPALPDAQRDAIAHLRYGPATRFVAQFARRFWVHRGRPNAFGSDQPIGAVWDGNEQQKTSRAGILSLLAGGTASGELQAILRSQGVDGVVARLAWLGRPAPVLASRTIVWDDDPFARGGYAYFDPGFDPLWRDWLARPAGRVLFAGEHTSIRWQGYMEGAVQSGQRAAAEVLALAKHRQT